MRSVEEGRSSEAGEEVSECNHIIERSNVTAAIFAFRRLHITSDVSLPRPGWRRYLFI